MKISFVYKFTEIIWKSEEIRNCTMPQPNYGGSCLVDKDGHFKTRKTICKPVDGQWSEWSDEEHSEEICVENEDKTWSKTVRRNCSEPEPKFGGKYCHEHEGI